MKVAAGLVLCLASLLLLQQNQLTFGFPAFIIGIILMYGGKWPRR